MTGLGDDVVDPLHQRMPPELLRSELRELAAARNAILDLLDGPPPRRSYTGAEVHHGTYTDHNLHPPRTRKLLLKVLPLKVLPPDGRSQEPGRHRRALHLDREFAREHLVGQPLDPVRLSNGRWVLFFEVANGGDRLWSLDDLAGQDLLDTFRTVVAALLHRWNGATSTDGQLGLPVERTTVDAYLRQELAAADAETELHDVVRRFGFPVTRDEPWVINHLRREPNPLRLLAAPYGDVPVWYCYGLTHGDLHGGNVVGPGDSFGRPLPGAFRLIDLDGFEEAAPLSRDPVCLLLTTVLRLVSDFGSPESDALAEYLIHPDRPCPPNLRGPAVDLVRIVHEEGRRYSSPDWVSEWRTQARLSLVSQALVCATYTDLGPHRRRWCLVLAARASAVVEQELPTDTGRSAGGSGPPEPPRVGPRGEGGGRPGWAGTTPVPAAGQGGVGLAERPPPGRHRAQDPPVQWAGRARFHAVDAPVPRGHRPLQIYPPARGPGHETSASRLTERVRSDTAGEPPVTAHEIPHQRRSVDETVDGPGAQRRRRRPLTRCLARGAVLVAALAATVGVVHQVGTSSGSPRPGTDRHAAGTGRDPVDPTAPQQLMDLALRAARVADEPGTGSFAYFCLRTWSLDRDERTLRQDRYRDEQSWITADGAVRQAAVEVVAGRRLPATTSTYSPGASTVTHPLPAEDPDVLRRQLRELADQRPHERSGAVVALDLVLHFHRYHLLTPGQRAALLAQLAETPALAYRGDYTDWNGRHGVAVSAADGTDGQVTATFDRQTGRLLSHERIRGDRVTSYTSLRMSGRTDVISQAGCS
ncbi:hypothetical protein [Micromonospora sp. NPDC023956]|uniref:hypothetical protein n=1 Tax=Micromonospora sp. NPDC023956 TaxID=3155722 RepID=UPI0033E1F091